MSKWEKLVIFCLVVGIGCHVLLSNEKSFYKEQDNHIEQNPITYFQPIEFFSAGTSGPGVIRFKT